MRVLRTFYHVDHLEPVLKSSTFPCVSMMSPCFPCKLSSWPWLRISLLVVPSIRGQPASDSLSEILGAGFSGTGSPFNYTFVTASVVMSPTTGVVHNQNQNGKGSVVNRSWCSCMGTKWCYREEIVVWWVEKSQGDGCSPNSDIQARFPFHCTGPRILPASSITTRRTTATQPLN